MLNFAVFIHQRFAIALLILTVILGLWGTYEYARFRRLSGGFRSTYLLMGGLTALQGLAGILAYLYGGHPREVVHIVYGIFAVLFLPAVYLYTARSSKDREALLLALSCWIVGIAYARGWFTGQ